MKRERKDMTELYWTGGPAQVQLYYPPTTSPADFDDVDRGQWYRVRGRNCETSSRMDCGSWSDWSAVIEVPDTLEIPPTPTGFTAGSTDRTSVDLEWDSRAGIAKYKVEYSTDGITWMKSDEAITGTTHTVSSLTCHTNYQFRISGYGDGVTYAEEWGSTATVSDSTELCLPPAPTGVTVTTTLITALVRWDTLTGGGISEYEVDSDEVGPEGSSGRAPQGVNTFKQVSGLTPRTNYDFKVRAFGDGVTYASEWGDWSDTVRKATKGAPPTGLSLSIEAGDDNNLDLTYVQSGESSHYYQFELHSSATETGTYTLVETNNESTTSPADFDDVDRGQWYRVRGRNCETSSRMDCGSWSDWSAVIEVPPVVEEISLAACSNDVVVPNSAANLELVSDCEILVAIIIELRVSAPVFLNWGPHIAITAWEGVSIGSVVDPQNNQATDRITGWT